MERRGNIFHLLLVFLFINGCAQIVNITSNTSDSTAAIDRGDTLFVAAAEAIKSGDIAELKQLLNRYPYLANARDSRELNGEVFPRSLLHILAEPPAHRKNRVEIAHLLVHFGCDINGKLYYRHGETPLHWAASSGDEELITALIHEGAIVDATGGSIDNGTPLVNAIHYGNTRAAQTLVEAGAVVFNFALAAGLGDKELMSRFVDFGELKPSAARKHPNEKVHGGLSPHEIHAIYQQGFTYAVFNHQFDIANELLKSGVNINQQWGNDNFSLLHRVAQRGTKDMANFLIAHGADISQANTVDGLTPVQVASRYNNTRVEQVLNDVLDK